MVDRTVSWVEGPVDSSREHIQLCFGDAWTPVALVAPADTHRFAVEFLIDPGAGDDAAEAVREARRELDYYLVEKGEENPWGYAMYHGGTTSNLVYSSIHWELRDPGGGDGDA